MPYYGAKFEPASGVIYGATYSNDPRIGEINDAKIRAQFPKAESTYLIYLEYGEDINALGRYKVIFDTARDNGKAVLLAVNTYNDMANIQNEGAYVQSVIDFLAGYPTVPVFFRFANEMNVGPNGTNPASYVAAFRFVADIARSAPNIALVWAPNDVSAIDRNLADYWPGNEYVDWVGVSLYTMKYWNGLDNQGGRTDDANTYFIAGYFANPIKRLEPIMEFMNQNGIQKPIMVAEGGDAHTLRQQGEDTTSWAMVQLNRRYSELIRKYPNLKLICYFNTSIAEEVYDFSLFGSPQMNALYNQLVENPYFLSAYNASAGFAYRPLKNADFEAGQSLKLSAVCYWPKALFTDVEYILNGQSLGKTNQTPYEVTTPPLANGANTLTVRAFTDGAQVLEKSFTLNAAQQVKVKLDGEYVPFYDVFPQIIDGRTMIPARGVFTAMGAQVGWDGASQKVTVVKDATTIELVIGSGQMWVNGAFVNLDVPAQIVNDRTLIPLRAVSEALGCAVDWDNDARCVIITQ